jgi:hypothetical protein
VFYTGAHFLGRGGGGVIYTGAHLRGIGGRVCSIQGLIYWGGEEGV